MLKAQRLQPFALFARLGPERLEQIAALCERRHFARRQRLAEQGAPADAFFLIEYGKVKVFRATADGREQVLHVVEPWQSFGEVAVLSLARYPASAEAMEETAALVVPGAPFIAMVERDGATARAMLAGQALWIRRLIDQSTALVLDDVQTRLARYLVVYADEHGVALEDGALLALEVKRSVIAAQIGTVPETLARNLGKLCDLGVLARRGKDLQILDAQGLRDLACPSGEG